MGNIYDGEETGISLTTPFIESEVSALVRKKTFSGIIQDQKQTVAVNKGNLNYELFLNENFHDWDVIYCSDLEDCFRSVDNGKADCVLMSNYRISQTEMLSEKFNLMSLPTGRSINFIH